MKIKSAPGIINRKLPSAPPVYRPQPVPKVLQRKSALGHNQNSGQAPRGPVAPPVYRPEVKKIVQPKIGSPQRSSPTAPPVYRPEQKRVAQPKLALAANVYRPPQSATVSRPQTNPVRAQASSQVQMKPQSGRLPVNMGQVRVIQRMEDKKKQKESIGFQIGSFLAPKISTIFSIPNIFAMVQFTSCVCLVFNRAGLSIEEVMNLSGDYRRTFEQVKEKWAMGGEGRPFYAMCPCTTEGSLSLEFSKFCGQCMMDDNLLGPNPLIVVIGHCAPGSDSITGDKTTGLSFSVGQVFDTIRPLMKKNCTIFLTPCSTAVSKTGSPSFQDRLITNIDDLDPEMYIIGTNSTSVPLGGEVITTGYTVKHSKKGEMPMEDFTTLPIIRTEPNKAKRRKKRRVITYIPTKEEFDQGKREKYRWEKRK